MSPDFEWPRFTHFAFFEHTGEFREAWAARGYAACSVADRRTMLPPSPGCMHVLGRVQDFLALYPHPIGISTSHVDCWPAASSNASNWQHNLGPILLAAELTLFMLFITAHGSNGIVSVV